MLERYLDHLTSYVESVCGTFPDSMPIDDESEPSVISEANLTPLRSTRHSQHPGREGAEALDLTTSPRNEQTLDIEDSSEDSCETDEWERRSAGEHRGGPIRNISRDANSTGIIDGAQPIQLRRSDSDRSLCDLIFGNHNGFSQEEAGFNPSIRKWKTVRDVQLFHGNLVLDCPVPKKILKRIDHATPPERDEYTHVRYSALTCHPADFRDSKFILRPSMFAKPRPIELFLAISVSENDFDSPAKKAEFARTLKSAIQTVYNENWDHVSKTVIWRNIVIGIITDGTVRVSSLSLLEDMGLYYHDARKRRVNNKDVMAHLYEYSPQLFPYVDKLEVKVVKGGPRPVQMLLCLQEKEHALPTQAWVECFGTSLGVRLCVMINPGMVVSGKKLFAMWETAGAQRRPGKSNSLTIIPYQESWMRSFRRSWISK